MRATRKRVSMPNYRSSPIWRRAYQQAEDYALLARFTRRHDKRAQAGDHSARAALRLNMNRRVRELWQQEQETSRAKG